MRPYSKPPIYKKGLPWERSKSQVPPKPSFSLLQGLGIKKPASPKKEAAPSRLGGFLGGRGYAKEWQLREFARKKAPYEYFPGTTKKMHKKFREDIMKELMTRAREIAKKEGRQIYGISDEMLKKIARRIENSSAPGGSELYHLHRVGKYLKERELKRKLQVWKEWGRGKAVKK